MTPDNPEYPVLLAARKAPFAEAMQALEEHELLAHKAANYGLIVELASARLTVLNLYQRPPDEQLSALERYLSMQPNVVARAEHILFVCYDCHELVPRFVPPMIAEIEAAMISGPIPWLLERLYMLGVACGLTPSATV